MNRQQRRLREREAARRYEFETRYAKEIQERQNHINDRFIMVYIVCIGLALYNCYGWKAKGIGRVIEEFNRLICQIGDEGLTFAEMNQELFEKTGVEFKLEDRE